MLGKGVSKGNQNLLEDTKLASDLSVAFNSSFNFPKDVMWHARLGHPHSRALNIMLPSISFQQDSEACILGKHYKNRKILAKWVTFEFIIRALGRAEF